MSGGAMSNMISIAASLLDLGRHSSEPVSTPQSHESPASSYPDQMSVPGASVGGDWGSARGSGAHDGPQAPHSSPRLVGAAVSLGELAYACAACAPTAYAGELPYAVPLLAMPQQLSVSQQLTTGPWNGEALWDKLNPTALRGALP